MHYAKNILKVYMHLTMNVWPVQIGVSWWGLFAFCWLEAWDRQLLYFSASTFEGRARPFLLWFYRSELSPSASTTPFDVVFGWLPLANIASPFPTWTHWTYLRQQMESDFHTARRRVSRLRKRRRWKTFRYISRHFGQKFLRNCQSDRIENTY